MTKERKTQIVTIAVLAAAFGVVLAQKTGWKISDVNVGDIVQRPAPKAEPSPQDAIYAMLDAARVGDVKAYLTSYTGQMDAALKQSLAELDSGATLNPLAQYQKAFSRLIGLEHAAMAVEQHHRRAAHFKSFQGTGRS